jgi:phage terminase Nu1 subunit (DNA packaging protein)
MSLMRAGDEDSITFSPEGERALDDLAEAMAATYDGSPESLDRLMRCVNTADVDDLATDLSVVANDLAPVDEVARRRLDIEQARTIPEAGTTDRQLPSYGW